jgi:hypothetical protein
MSVSLLVFCDFSLVAFATFFSLVFFCAFLARPTLWRVCNRRLFRCFVSSSCSLRFYFILPRICLLDAFPERLCKESVRIGLLVVVIVVAMAEIPRLYHQHPEFVAPVPRSGCTVGGLRTAWVEHDRATVGKGLGSNGTTTTTRGAAVDNGHCGAASAASATRDQAETLWAGGTAGGTAAAEANKRCG